MNTKTSAKGKCFGSPARQRDSLVFDFFIIIWPKQGCVQNHGPSEAIFAMVECEFWEGCKKIPILPLTKNKCCILGAFVDFKMVGFIF